MAIPTIFQRIKESVKVRKKAKKEIEEVISLKSENDSSKMVTLSTSYRFDKEKPIRLIDEGAIFYEGGNWIRLFIEKGTVQKFYDELDEDFVGYINLAHFDVFAFPIFLGTWTKSDLTIVDLEDGRQGLDVIPHFNEDLYLVKDLFAQEIPLSVSIEAYFDYNWNMTEKLEFPVVNGMQIDGFSVVGNPANTSSAYVLSNEEEKGENMDLSKIKAILENSEIKAEENEDLETKNAENVDNEAENEENAELTTTDVDKVDESENLETEEDSTENLENAEESEENSSENLENEENDEEQAILDLVSELVEQNKALKAELEALKAEKAQQNSKTESVISKLESIVNGTQQTKSQKQNTKDSVWG